MMLTESPLDQTWFRPTDSLFLAQIYGADYRKYHNLTHINKIWHTFLNRMDSMHRDEKARRAINIATVFHDVVFNVGFNDNEEKSAHTLIRWAMASGKYDVDPEIFDLVEQMILATKDHTNKAHEDSPAVLRYFLDLDLYDVGADWTTFYKNGDLILAEQLPFMSKNQIFDGRRAWIDKLLTSPRIFWIFKEREAQARENLNQELKLLEDHLNK